MHEAQRERVLLVGSTGLIGSAVKALLSKASEYEVVGVTRTTRPPIDLEDAASIEAAFDVLGDVAHVIVTAGEARFGGFDDLDAEAFAVGLKSKLMGQVIVAMAALRRVPAGGSVTLTSGALAHSPIPGSAAVALVNGALDSFVRAIALDVPRGRRINVVSPGWIRETRLRLGLDPDPGASARDVAKLYRSALQSDVHGRVISALEDGPS